MKEIITEFYCPGCGNKIGKINNFLGYKGFKKCPKCDREFVLDDIVIGEQGYVQKEKKMKEIIQIGENTYKCGECQTEIKFPREMYSFECPYCWNKYIKLVSLGRKNKLFTCSVDGCDKEVSIELIRMGERTMFCVEHFNSFREV